MTKHKITLPSGEKITSIVMSQEEFDKFCDDLEKVFDKPIADKIRKSRVFPMMRRWTKTQSFFDQLSVETDLLGVGVRGLAERLGLHAPSTD